MKKIVNGLLVLSFLSFFFPFVAAHQVHAQNVNSIGIANYFSINANKVEDGDIVIVTPKGYFLSSKPYDTQMVGVVSTTPAIVLKSSSTQKGYPVVTVGTVFVKVTGENGDIKKGDPLTTSSLPGTAMKSTQTGYVLGEALQATTFGKADEVKLVPLNLNLHFVQVGSPLRSSLLDIFTLSGLAAYEQPLRVFQYVIAAIIVIASFSFGFLIFARAVNTGIQALGRNPLAGRMIQLSIVFNLVLIIIIIMAGIFIAYIIMRL